LMPNFSRASFIPNCDAIVVIVTFLVKIVIFLCKDIVSS
jgi:hypothetical protein